MHVKGNICGNCANFKPKQSEKFFNCTFAKQADTKYGMQVRPDTQACDAFAPIKAAPLPKPAKSPDKPPPKQRQRRLGLCPWARIVLLAAIIILILLLAWGAYTLFFGGTAPAPTPTPTPAPTGTPVPTPTAIVVTPKPTPTPVPVYEYPFNTWVRMPNYLMQVSNVRKTTRFEAPQIMTAPAGTYYILATITVTNGSASAITVPPSIITIQDDFGLRYNALRLPALYQKPWTSGWVGAGRTDFGDLWFTVADVSTNLMFVVTTPDAIIKWRLPY